MLSGPPALVTAASLTFQVNSTADAPDAQHGDGVCATTAGQCTLRAAVQEGDAQPSGSAITIAVPAGTYILAQGTLSVTTNTVTLVGAGATKTVIAGHGNRVLNVAAGATANINKVAIVKGNAGSGDGGGILNAGTLLVRSSLLRDNTAFGGGAIANTGGTAAVVASEIISNSAPAGAGGGGIFNSGILTIGSTTVISNMATGSPGVYAPGGGVANTGTLTVTNSSIISNSVPTATYGAAGGGGLASRGGVATLSNTSVMSNSATYGGGGIAVVAGTMVITSSTIGGNTAPYGGAIGDQGTLLVANSTVSNNTGQLDAAGIEVDYGASLTLSTSAIVGNRAANGSAGGLENAGGIMTVTDSTISDNSAHDGGGINSNNAGTTVLTNTTLSGNVATGNGGAINDEENTGSVLTLSYVTVMSNSSGLAASSLLGTGSLTLLGTIIAGSTAGPNCSGPTMTSQGYNLDSGTSCGINQATDISNTAPLLGPLGDNGGTTQTMALLPGSPAIDEGGAATNGCPATDQRGVSRPQGAACDIGAFEVSP